MPIFLLLFYLCFNVYTKFNSSVLPTSNIDSLVTMVTAHGSITAEYVMCVAVICNVCLRHCRASIFSLQPYALM